MSVDARPFSMPLPRDNYAPAPARALAAPSPCCIPARVLFAVLSSACFAISYGANVVLSIAIVAMVNHTAIAGGENQSIGRRDSWANVTPLMGLHRNAVEPECPPPPGHETDKDGPFAWDDVVQGYLRGAYYWGYLVGQVPGALWAERRGAKWLLLVANVVNIVGLLVTPVVAYAHWAALMAVRICLGLAGAVTFPAMHVMISHWATPEQRGLIAGVIYGGTSFGTIGATLIGGYLAASVDWTWVFYAIGLASVPWCPLWAIFVTDRPNDGLIPGEVSEQRLQLPLKSILASCPFWAILITHFCNNCGWYLYLTELPGFMEEVLHKNIKENAGMSTIPYALMWVLNVSLGWGLDGLRKRGRLSTGAMRKIATSIASLVPCACLIGISFIGCNADAGTALITVAIMACGGMFVGVLSNHLDISPNFAGRLMAITNTIATIPGIAMPSIIGILTEGQETLSRWSIAFYATAALYGVMFLVFLVFSSGDVQPWNTPPRPLRPEEQDPLIRARGNTLDPYDPLPPSYGSLTVPA